MNTQSLQVVASKRSRTALQRLAEDYLAHKRAAGLSPKTLRDNYGFALERVFLPWCDEEGITEPAQLDARAMDRFSLWVRDTPGARGPRSLATVKTYVEAVNWFLSWAQKEGEIGRLRAPAPKQPKKVLDVLTREEIDLMEGVARFERDKLLVRLLADTGIRLGEALGLRDEDLILEGRDHRYLRVREKGARERLVPVKPELFRRLQRLARQRPADVVHDIIMKLLREGQ